MTRFGKISPLWQNFKSLAILRADLLFGDISNLNAMAKFYAVGQNLIAANGQILRK